MLIIYFCSLLCVLNKSLLMVQHSVPGTFWNFIQFPRKCRMSLWRNFELPLANNLPLNKTKDAGESNQMQTIKETTTGNSLVVQQLRLHASTTGDSCLIPGWGTKIPQATWYDQEKNKKATTTVDHNFYYWVLTLSAISKADPSWLYITQCVPPIQVLCSPKI